MLWWPLQPRCLELVDAANLNPILAIFSIYKLDLFLPPISSRLSLHKYGVCFGKQQASRLAVIRAWTDFRRILIKTSTDAGELLPIFEIFDHPRRRCLFVAIISLLMLLIIWH